MPFCIGLTGGIGSGKSRAAALFAERGAAVVDTDAIAHELTRADGAAIPSLLATFGATVLAADGSLNRDAMRARVFSDPGERQRLEHVLHPLIREHARKQVLQSATPYVLLVVPLLLETGAYRDLVNRVLVVDCSESQQIARTMARSHLAEAAVRAIMAAQLPRAERLAQADDVIRNDGDIAHLQAQVLGLHQHYLQLVAAGLGATGDC